MDSNRQVHGAGPIPSHTCPAIGCDSMVPGNQLACATDWYRLPSELRARIWRAYRAKDIRTHRATIREAIRWYAEHPKR